MAEKMPSLSMVICVIDHIHQIELRRELIELCCEELDNPDEKSTTRIGLLLDSYLAQTEHHFDELKCYTRHLQSELIKLRQAISPDQPLE